MKLSDKGLMALGLGALDPGERAMVELALGAQPGLAWRQQGLLALAGQPPMRSPPAVRGEVDRRDHLGEGANQPGDRIALRIGAELPADTVRLAIFRSVAGMEAERIFPRRLDTWPTLDAFGEEAGQRVVHLVLEAPEGHHTYEALLVPADLTEVGCSEAELRVMLEAGRAGGLPRVVFQVEVSLPSDGSDRTI